MMNLTPRVMLGDLDLTDYPFAMEFGADYGMSQNIVRIIESGLEDGEIQRVTGNSNRTFEIPLLVEGSDLQAMNLAEQLLAVECNKDLNELRIDPGDGFAPTTVYTTFRAQWGFQRDDVMEQNGYRRYRLTIAALPFGYSEDEVVDVAVAAPPVSPTTVVISDGTSATGWTSPNGAVTSSGGSLVVSAPEIPGTYAPDQFADYRLHGGQMTLAMSATNFAATQYLTAEVKLTNCYAITGYAYADDVQLQQISQTYLGEGYKRVTWRCLDSSVTSLRIDGIGTSAVAPGAPAPVSQLQVDNVSRSNVGPTPTTTGRESFRTIAVSGSARTAASLAVEHETLGLGDVLFYSSSALGAGYTPDLRPWQAGAPTVTDDADNTVSGFYSTSSSIQFDVPAYSLPDGPHLVMFRGRSNSAGTTDATVTVRTLVNGVPYGETVLQAVTLPGVAEAFEVVTAGVVTLPGVQVPPQSDTIVQFEIGGFGSIQIDEVWSFYLGEDSDLTYVKAGTGTPSLGTVHNRLFVESPSIGNGGAPGLFVGTTANGSDAFHPGYPTVRSWGRHPFVPPEMAMFIVTTGGGNPVVTLRHRPAWHTHAAS